MCDIIDVHMLRFLSFLLGLSSAGMGGSRHAERFNQRNSAYDVRNKCCLMLFVCEGKLSFCIVVAAG